MGLERSVLDDFVAEAEEHLQTMDEDIVSIEKYRDSPDPELIGRVFRSMHSIKGAAGFLGLTTMSALSHVMENILSKIRDAEIRPDSTYTGALLAGIDLLRAMLHQADESNFMDIGSVYDQLTYLLDKGAACEEPEAAPQGLELTEDSRNREDPEAPIELQFPEEQEVDGELLQMEITPAIAERFVQEAEELLEKAEDCFVRLKDSPANANEILAECYRAIHSFKGNCGFMELADLQRLSHKVEELLECLKAGSLKFAGAGNVLLQIVDVLREGVADVSQGGKGVIDGCDLMVELLDDMTPSTPAAPCDPIVPAPADPVAPAPADPITLNVEVAPENKQPGPAPASSSPACPQGAAERPRALSTIVRRDIRVDLEKLDALVNLVGELVIAEAMVTRNSDLTGLELENFDRAAHHLRRIITDIQDVAMAVRMIPLSTTFRKMIRLVHDLSEKQQKAVRLELIGEETEVDKTVIELIADPLVHIVRNAVDHGIEKPEERRGAGKPETGLVCIEARHEGGEVLILIRDDGRGLSREKLLARGIERGLIGGNGSEMSDSQVFQLIFEPGLSTAAAVTDVSGRGVGMDVVKKNIEKLKGRVDIRSKQGEGSIIVLRIPLTLAIMEGMLVRVGSARYTIPILTIRETFQPDDKQITLTMDGQEVVKVRREIIPVIRLHELFNKAPDHVELSQGILIIVEYDRKRVCLLVDEILGQYQTVIKGLPDYLESVQGVSGCTILGDGKVSLILDVAGIMSRVGRGF